MEEIKNKDGSITYRATINIHEIVVRDPEKKEKIIQEKPCVIMWSDGHTTKSTVGESFASTEFIEKAIRRKENREFFPISMSILALDGERIHPFKDVEEKELFQQLEEKLNKVYKKYLRIDYTGLEVEESILKSVSLTDADTLFIPDGITVIGNAAFGQQTYDIKIGKVILPKGLKKIEKQAFVGLELTKSETLVIPDTVEYIGESAFDGLNITHIKLPNKIKSISKNLFANCEWLKEIDLPDTIEEIGENAFSTCAIKSIHLSESLKKIGQYAFQFCEELEYIEIPDFINEIDESVFSGCKKLHTIKFPNSLLKIKQSAFENCESLIEIKIPKTVQEIEDWAFFGCRNLMKVIIPKHCVYDRDWIFGNGSNDIEIIEYD